MTANETVSGLEKTEWQCINLFSLFLSYCTLCDYFACMHVCVPSVCLLGSLELGLQVIVSYHVDVAFKPRSSTRGTSAFRH